MTNRLYGSTLLKFGSTPPGVYREWKHKLHRSHCNHIQPLFTCSDGETLYGTTCRSVGCSTPYAFWNLGNHKLNLDNLYFYPGTEYDILYVVIIYLTICMVVCYCHRQIWRFVEPYRISVSFRWLMHTDIWEMNSRTKYNITTKSKIDSIFCYTYAIY